MKVARIGESGRMNLLEEPQPTPGPGQVLIEVRAVGLCGSDRHFVLQDDNVYGSETINVVPGHEAAGVIAALGPGVDQPPVGTPVYIEPAQPCHKCRYCKQGRDNICPDVRFLGHPPVNGAMRQYMTHPAALVIPVSGQLSFEQIAMAEPLAVVLYALQRTDVSQARSAAVIGCGTIGLLLVQMLVTRHVPLVLAADRLAYKLPLAGNFGAGAVVDTSARDLVAAGHQASPPGFDLVFEAAGNVETPALAVELAAPGGCVVLIGLNSQEIITYPAPPARRKELTIINLHRSTGTTGQALKLIQDAQVDVASLVTHRFSLDKINDAFATFVNYRDGVVKVCVDPATG